MKIAFSGWFWGGSFIYIAFFCVKKNGQKSDFRPKNALFRSNLGLLSSKLGQKNNNGEFFAAAEPNNNCFVISGLKIEKTGPETAKISPKMAKKSDFRPFLGQIWVFSAKNWVKRTATVNFLQLQSQTTIIFVISGLKIEKTGPETAKISPKMAKKATFDHFSVKYGSFQLKTGLKERQR